MNKSYLIILFLIFLSSINCWYTKNQIQKLPGIDNITEMIFTGHVSTADTNHNSSLFYWFVEQTNTNDQKPVIVWLNGG